MYKSYNLQEASRIQKEIEGLLKTKNHLRDHRYIEFKNVSLYRALAMDPSIDAFIPDFYLDDYPEIISFLDKLIQKEIDEKSEKIKKLLEDKA